MKSVVVTFLVCFTLNLFPQKPVIDSLITVYKKAAQNDTNKTNVAIKLITEYRQAGDSSKALLFGRRAIESATAQNWQKGLAKAYGILGSTQYVYANYAKALEYHYKALEINEKIHNEPGIANSYHNIGNIYLDKKEFKNALLNYKKSTAINEKLNDRFMLSNTYNNIANTYKTMGDFTNAILYYTKSFMIRKERQDKRGLASSYINIGTLFIKISGMPADSGKKYTAALNMNLKSDLKKVLLDSAYLMQKEAIKINIDLNNIVALSYSYKALGSIDAERADLAHALPDLKTAYEYASKADDPVLMTEISKEIYELYKSTKNYADALLWHETYNAINEKLSSEENQKEFGRQEAKFEYEKQQALSEIVHQKEKAVQETAKQKQKLILWFTLFVLLLAIIISVFIYNRLKVSRHQNKIIENQKREVENQKLLVEEKQKEIVDSINYAKRIQYTLLAHKDFMNEYIPENFVLFKPKDIVSGDFYWSTKHNNKFYLAVCDSTGHGVPGAFMSLLNIRFLNEAINEKNITEPNKIFDHVRERLIGSISQDGAQDGMDGILICMEPASNRITYASANNAPVLISSSVLVELPKDKMPVGKGERTESFNLYNIEAKRGDMLYLFTDGYADQFGGPKGKKFKYKQLAKLLVTNAALSMDEQQQLLTSTLENWKGSLEQVDDVCVIGIKIL